MLATLLMRVVTITRMRFVVFVLIIEHDDVDDDDD